MESPKQLDNRQLNSLLVHVLHSTWSFGGARARGGVTNCSASIHLKRLWALFSSFWGVWCGSSSSSVEPAAGAIAEVVTNRPLVLAHHKSINHPAEKLMVWENNSFAIHFSQHLSSS